MKKFKKVVAITVVATITLATTMLSACMGVQEAESERVSDSDPVTIKWYMAGSGPQADVQTVQEAVNEYLLEAYDMNIDLQLIATDYANYSQKMQMVIASGEEYDICWTSSWNNSYYDNVNKNAFIELEELLEVDALELFASMDENIWNAVRINGNIYGVPSQQIFTKQNYVAIVKQYVDKYNLDTSKIKKLSDLEEFFMQVKADEPEVYPMAASSNGFFGKLNLAIGYELLAGGKVPGCITLEGNELKVLNQYEELESLKEFYDLMYKWQQEGLIRKDAATVSDNAVPDMKAGKHIAAVNSTFKPGVEAIESANFGGREVELITLSDPYLVTDSFVSSLNAISRTSKNPEVAMKLLNLVNTDATLYNLLCFGVEGTHYNLNEEGKAVSDDSKGYNPNVDWMFGNQFNGLIREGQEDNIWEETLKLNKSAVPSKVLGFAFDHTTVTNELAAVNAVLDQYVLSLDTGAVDPEKLMPELIEKLKAASVDKIIEELQTQLDAWVAKQ